MARYQYYRKRKIKHYKERKRHRTIFFFKRYNLEEKTWSYFAAGRFNPAVKNISTSWLSCSGLQKNQKKYKPVEPESYKCPHCQQKGCLECRRHPFSLWHIAQRMTNK